MQNDGKIHKLMLEKLGDKANGFIVRRAVASESAKDLAIECLFPIKLTDKEKRIAEDIIKSEIPKMFDKVEIVCKTIFVDDEVLSHEILSFISKKNYALTARIKQNNIEISYGKTTKIVITYDDTIGKVLAKDNVLADLQKHLNGWFCGDYEIVGNEYTRDINLQEVIKKLDEACFFEETKNIRKDVEWEVLSKQEFVGTVSENVAKKIVSVSGENKSVVMVGEVQNLDKRLSKKEKTFYKFNLKDPSGKMLALFFPSVGLIDKVDEELKDGEWIVARGYTKFDSETRATTFFPSAIAFCEKVEQKEEEIVYKQTPEKYRVITPFPVSVSEQNNMFEEIVDVSKIDVFKDKRFVVFDLETTGLEAKMDEITEFAGVAIENGIITNALTTLINPQVKISKEITEITGIDNEMVKDKPDIEKVIGDIVKFCDKSILVGHNVGFDYSFLSKALTKFEYSPQYETMDTLVMARSSVKGLSNYKLNTLCEHLKVDLTRHHRAMCDALATAQVFIKLCVIGSKAKK